MTDAFVLISRPDLDTTNELFARACAARGIPFHMVIPGAASAAGLPTSGRRLIYAAATDRAALLLEKLMVRPGDALLHDPHFPCDHAPIRLARAGLPMARAVYLPARDAEARARQVDWLGGYPLVVKRPGMEGGAGICRVDEDTALLAAVEAAGFHAMIETFVEHTHCWRLAVLNGRVLAATAMAAAEGDFRTNAPGGRIVDAALPGDATEIAIQAISALHLEFGGVDIMEGPDGTLTLAEVNFPCYFAHLTEQTGADIAGAIVDHLRAV